MLKTTKVLGMMTLFFFIIDRISKLFALTLNNSVKVLETGFSWLPDIYFRLVFNRGMSWGILNSENDYVFWAVSVFICIVTIFLFRYLVFKYRHNLSIFPESLVLLGSLSNIFDRFIYGGVIDFILADFRFWTFPVFNLADCAIVLGVFLMFLDLIKNEDNA